MQIDRTIRHELIESLRDKNRVIIVYGPRQAGKTTLIQSILPSYSGKTLLFTGDDLYAQEIFSRNELASLSRIVGDTQLLVIDEAQRIPNIGLTFKLLVDHFPITILASGSSSFELANRLNEPLTGRTKTFCLYPFSYNEVEDRYRQISKETALSEMLRYGMYPKVHTFSSEEEKQTYLYELVNNYLYKDILMYGDIRKPNKVIDLLSLLALQIGQEVSIAELSSHLALSGKAVENYLDLLEKMFVIVNIRGFSRNLRKEIYKTSKYFFYDTGLRNALIRNFNPLHLRSDSGGLFENWFIMEKIKKANNYKHFANFYFWRTYDQKEIDLIEEREGKLFAFECKWSADQNIKVPKDWSKSYPSATFFAVHKENYFEFLNKA